MLILINAFKSITRSKGRNILIGIIVLTIAVSSCIALSIKNAASTLEKSGLELANITGSISVDREKLMANVQNSETSNTDNKDNMRDLMGQYSELTLDELTKYGDSSYVKSTYYSTSISLNATDDIEAVSDSSSSTTTSSSKQNDNGSLGGNGGPSMSMGDFTVTGYSSESAMTKFINGTSKITDGQMFDVESSDLTAIISNELAVFNNLKVGDEIILSNPNKDDEIYKFTIVGIYTNTSTTTTNDNMRFSTSMDPSNLIYIGYNSIKIIIDNSSSVATTTTDSSGRTTITALTSQLSYTYTFANKDNYDNFSKELTEKGLSEYYSVSSTDISNYEASLIPLKNLSSFATTMLFIILGVGGIILIVINIFNIRERKYEVGVLTAIGIKKNKVAMQFVVELLAVTLIAIFIGTGIGAVTSVPIANKLLESQISTQEATTQNQNQNFGRGPDNQGGAPGSTTTNVSYLNEINATINITILGKLIGIGIILTMISSLGGIIFVLRYEPLKILANRA